MSIEEEMRKRLLENHIATAINSLYAVKANPNSHFQEKLKTLDLLQKMLPEIRRLIIYFENIRSGH